MSDSVPGLVHVIGASGRSGAALCRALGAGFVPVVRDPARWALTGLPGAPRVADLGDAAALQAALADAEAVVSCAHARHAGAVIAAAPLAARFVFLGSTRKFSRWRDAHGDAVRAGEAAFLASGRPGVMLHPTMIYGAEGEDNVRRLAVWLRRLPVVPLPGGGRSLVQPIHQSDVTRAIVAALGREWDRAETLVIAGGEAVTYARFVRAVGRAAGVGPRLVVGVPGWVMRGAAWATRVVPVGAAIGGDEVRRLMEDKAFDVGGMRERLGVAPMGLAEGLAVTFKGPF